MLRPNARERRVEIAKLVFGVAGLAQLVPARERQRLDVLTNTGVGVIGEPGRSLHDVGIGVVDESSGDVRHREHSSVGSRSAGLIDDVDLATVRE